MSLISVVIPVFNEEGNLETLYKRLAALEFAGGDRLELLFVDDGSGDRSREIIRDLARKDPPLRAAAGPRVRYLFFSRNFGHERATTAGMDRANGEAAVIIDSDLQDPPELIPEMVRQVMLRDDIASRGRIKRTNGALYGDGPGAGTDGPFPEEFNLSWQ